MPSGEGVVRSCRARAGSMRGLTPALESAVSMGALLQGRRHCVEMDYLLGLR